MAATVQSILQEYSEQFAQNHPLSLEQRLAAERLRDCRTPALGGHVVGCPEGPVRTICCNSCRHRDSIPVTVPFAATPAGEPPGIDQWAHRAVWTDRMLATLLQDKVRGGKWHTLNDKVCSELNLFCSAHQVLGKEGAAGVDRQTVGDFAEQEQEELRRLQEQLRDGSYCPAPVRRVMIPKPGSQEKRPLGIPKASGFSAPVSDAVRLLLRP